ncbi:hypothetical protein [Stieleria varia]|uniref:Uncharacterized protein n=1 Tax=Stieleria varia TaxID=2528005 RepID=A0A5C6B2P4_9BACT|nr:hypothetical protein [Stieleria varia]TWU05699.1 hypothetical protein Pla52n_14140 [Stieleria varia]
MPEPANDAAEASEQPAGNQQVISEQRPSLIWWVLLFVVMLGSIGMSFAANQLMTRAVAHGDVLLYGCSGASQGFSYAPAFALLVLFAIHHASLTRRLTLLFCFLLPQAAVIALYWIITSHVDYRVSTLAIVAFTGPVVSILAYCMATFLSLMQRWTIRSAGDDQETGGIGISKLFESTLVVSVGCVIVLRAGWFSDVVNVMSMTYSIVYDWFPAIGLSITTCCLYALFLTSMSARRRIRLGLLVLATTGTIAMISVGVIHRLEAPFVNPIVIPWPVASYSVAYITSATLAQIPMLWCLRRAGLTLVTRHS